MKDEFIEALNVHLIKHDMDGFCVELLHCILHSPNFYGLLRRLQLTKTELVAALSHYNPSIAYNLFDTIFKFYGLEINRVDLRPYERRTDGIL